MPQGNHVASFGEQILSNASQKTVGPDGLELPANSWQLLGSSRAHSARHRFSMTFVDPWLPGDGNKTLQEAADWKR
ncbi:hypothetical protein RRG08_027996 [Elysia crispata]|uniref:Uncharacterized protein n=1 Tax=Elysia crispata TaxID=231223 RepID=A0AAE1BBR0_9GAST|nr:hypothetical protein RRG08_027996 [Elysia crispata]